MTPAQLVSKRAKDRIAQRNIRAKTREYIEHLERDVENLRGKWIEDKTIQGLLLRNKALEDDVRHLKENIAVSATRTYFPAAGTYQKPPANPPHENISAHFFPDVYADDSAQLAAPHRGRAACNEH